MGKVHFSWRNAAIGMTVLVAFAVVVAVDRGVGWVSRIWPIAFWGSVVAASVAVYVRLWRNRHDPGQSRRIQQAGLYGVLPESLRRFLFP